MVQLAQVLQSTKVPADEKEISMTVLNGLPPWYEEVIVPWEALGNNDKLFTLDQVGT